MTALLAESTSANLWAAMPGWGIVADLTPPELVEMRRLTVLRKYMTLALATVVLLCVGGYFWAGAKTATADDRLAAANAGTAPLTAANAKYADVVALQDATHQVNSQIASLMASDVDVAAFVLKLQQAAPKGTTLTTLTVTLAAPSAAAPNGLTTDPVIGAVTIAGNSRRMVDVASYVTALQDLRGVTAVVPSSNTAATNATAAWTIALQMTDKLYSHRFDPAATTGDVPAGGSTTGVHR